MKINLKKFFRTKYEIILVPKKGTSSGKVFKIGLIKFAIILVVLLLFSNSILLSVLAFTPMMDFVPGFDIISHEEVQQFQELKKKMIQITADFERIKRNNERLNLLLEGKTIPYDKRLLDSNYVKEKMRQDSINLLIKKPSFENNILLVFRHFLENVLSVSYKNELTNDSSHFSSRIFFISPVQGIITQDFDPKNGHYGIDFGIKRGTQVRAACSGIVIFSDYTINDGYKLILLHNEGYISIYKHLDILLKKEKEKVNQGDVIALSGNTGKLTTAPHLHFEVWKNNQPINPKKICVDFYEN